MSASDPFNVRQSFTSGSHSGTLYSLPALEKQGVGPVSRLPVSIRIVLESVLRNCDGKRITEDDVRTLASWKAADPAKVEIPFVVARIVLQDFTGVPLLVDLAAMRDAAKVKGKDPSAVEPLVPVDLVVDHSVQVDRAGSVGAFQANLDLEFERNRERYEFLKWGQQAFKTFSVVPPGIGIVHQVNLEHLAKVVFETEGPEGTVFYPDSLVGTDSHTTMINGLGIVGWGVGGIEAEAGMLGQPVYFLTPEVIGVELSGGLAEGVTATDLTLRVTEMLRQENVVGKFIEFFGEGVEQLSLADRATIANMAPEYGATMGFFPIDDKSLEYLRLTGRSDEHIQLVKDYFEAQGMYGVPRQGEIDYSQTLQLDLSTIVPSVAGPKRPQDRIGVDQLGDRFRQLLSQPTAEGGYGIGADEMERRVRIGRSASSVSRSSGGSLENFPEGSERNESEMVTNRPTSVGYGDGRPLEGEEIGHGSILIAAITSCTNTSNPSVMIGAGLVAKKARAKGLSLNPIIKASLAPGSRVVTDYLRESGLDESLDDLGFHLVGYGCTTCIGNSGPLEDGVESALKEGNVVAASVLSGNRNFEARVHGAIKANFLMSPPLVVAYALAGRVDIDLTSEPIGEDDKGQPVFLKDIWPSQEEVAETVAMAVKSEMFKEKYASIMEENPKWNEIASSTGQLYQWDPKSTYIHNPPFFEDFATTPGTIQPIKGMRALAIFGDSVTTDHISPAGAIPEDGPAGRYLKSKGVETRLFNSFGSRRGNNQIMTRGTFANVRIKNLMAEGKEGGWTRVKPENDLLPIFEASQRYANRDVPLIVVAGKDYGMGSSRDWAAKGTALLGVKAVLAESFERIHRSNLIGMGVLPLQFPEGETRESLGLDGESEIYSLPNLTDTLKPRQKTKLIIEKNRDFTVETMELMVTVRIDTDIEVDYYRHGGILPFVLRQILAEV